MSLSIENKPSTTNACQERSKSAETSAEKYSGLKNIGSIALAYGGAMGVEYLGKKVMPKVGKKFIQETSFSSLILNGKDAKNIFNSSGLAKKGVKLKNVDYKNFKYTAISQFRKNGKSWNIWGKLKARGLDQAKNLTSIGLASYYIPKDKTIINNFKSLGMSIPHEMGHAANFTSKNPLLKILTKSRKLQIFALPILAVTILKKPKEKTEKSKSLIGKSLDFIKENCISLTTACMAPTVIEEGIASIRGAKIAKKFLTPQKIKAINTANFWGWATYALQAGIMIAGVFAADKIRNKTAPSTQLAEQEHLENTDNLDIAA